MFYNMYSQIIKGTDKSEVLGKLEDMIKKTQNELGIKLNVTSNKDFSVQYFQPQNPNVRLVAIAADYESAVAKINRDFPGVVDDDSLSKEVIIDSTWELTDDDAKKVGSKGPGTEYDKLNIIGYGKTYDEASKSYQKDHDTAKKRFDVKLDNKVDSNVVVNYFSKENGARISSSADTYENAVSQAEKVFGDLSDFRSDVRILSTYQLTKEEAVSRETKPPVAGPIKSSTNDLDYLVGDL